MHVVCLSNRIGRSRDLPAIVLAITASLSQGPHDAMLRTELCGWSSRLDAETVCIMHTVRCDIDNEIIVSLPCLVLLRQPYPSTDNTLFYLAPCRSVSNVDMSVSTRTEYGVRSSLSVKSAWRVLFFLFATASARRDGIHRVAQQNRQTGTQMHILTNHNGVQLEP